MDVLLQHDAFWSEECQSHLPTYDVPHLCTSIGKNHGNLYKRHGGQIKVYGRPYSSLARCVLINEVAPLAIESRQVRVWVVSGNFLGFPVSQRGIEMPPGKSKPLRKYSPYNQKVDTNFHRKVKNTKQIHL